MAYFGCDQSQVQRYLSGRTLTESRLSLLFNAFLKVPMQFLILLTGVLVFVFFHFHETPLLWNSVELARLERKAPPGELGRVRQEAGAAHAARAAAASAFADARHAGADAAPARAAYLAAQERLGAAERDVRALASRVAGEKVNDVNYIFPSYIVSRLRGGLAGLVLAVIFAAAMSALAGELNSLATATMVDFYQRFVRPGASASHDLFASRVFTAFWGLFAAAVATRAGQLGSAIEVVNRFGSYFYGSILGVFALAILTPRATARGASGDSSPAWRRCSLVSQTTAVAFLWYNVIGAVTVFAVGLVITAVAPGSVPPGPRHGGAPDARIARGGASAPARGRARDAFEMPRPREACAPGSFERFACAKGAPVR